eukprot:gene5441-biopygen14761
MHVRTHVRTYVRTRAHARARAHVHTRILPREIAVYGDVSARFSPGSDLFDCGPPRRPKKWGLEPSFFGATQNPSKESKMNHQLGGGSENCILKQQAPSISASPIVSPVPFCPGETQLTRCLSPVSARFGPGWFWPTIDP